MDVTVKMARFQIKQNVLNLKSTLAISVLISKNKKQKKKQMKIPF